jgi:hypothetical protein
MKMILNDEIHFNSDFTQFSLIPLEGYSTWSIKKDTVFKGYNLDRVSGKLTNVSNPTFNFEVLRKIWLSAAGEDCEEIKNYEQLINEHNALFLDEKCPVPRVFFGSMPRSGNSFSRRLMESVTGVVTGSNFNFMPSINFALML